MRLQQIAGTSCRDNYCPAVFRTDDGDYVVQGYTVERSGLDPAPNVAPREDLVRIPATLIDELVARAMAERAGRVVTRTRDLR